MESVGKGRYRRKDTHLMISWYLKPFMLERAGGVRIFGVWERVAQPGIKIFIRFEDDDLNELPKQKAQSRTNLALEGKGKRVALKKLFGSR